MKILYCWLGIITFIPSMVLAKQKVAIIGAGSAGIAAAERILRDKDTEVQVFDRSHRIGGKAYTLPAFDGSGVVELGAIQVGISYETVMNYAYILGEPMRDYWSPQSLRFAENRNEPIIQSSGDEYAPWSKAWELKREIAVMNEALKRFEPYKKMHLTNIPENSEFNQPFETWADQQSAQGLPLFKEMFRVWITSYGYGDLKAIPAYLPIYAINSSLGQTAFLHYGINLRMLSRGFTHLLERMVEHYKIPVKKEVQITHVKRDGDHGVDITYLDNTGTSYQEHYDYLVVACGVACIQDFMDDKTPEETEILDLLYVSPYDVAIADVPGLPKGGYSVPQNLVTERLGHVGLLSKNTAGGNDVIIYVPSGQVRKATDPVPTRSQETDALQIASIQADMARFGYENTKIKHLQHWDNYFPHFRDPRGYKIANEIQGKNSTIYVGGFARWEYVETSMKHAIDMVEEHIFGISSIQEESKWKEIKRAVYWWWNAENREKIDESVNK